MDKRTIMAFVVIGIIIILMPYYQQWLNPQDETDVIQQETTATVQETAPAQTPPPDYVRPQASIEPRVLTADAKEIVIANNKYAINLSNLGGGTVRDYMFFEYKDKDGGNLHLLPVESGPNLNVEYTNLYQDPSELEYIAFDCPALDSYKDGDTLWVETKHC